ncbi:hypothetical protein FBU30_009155 [Linnemannia zychae]|nr:hypothetical protein FBU30_009155 [Linnemannia zychae]
MSNSAVAKWLEEIAAAKAKAQAKEQEQQQQQQQQTKPINISTDREESQSQPRSPLAITTKTVSTKYGIITSYNLRTRKKQLRLILPPEPRKPEPEECCGNDCDPCVNTIYWKDLEAHREKCKSLQHEYEIACRMLEDNESDSSQLTQKVEDMKMGQYLEEIQEDSEGLSIRSYRAFKVLEKRYLTENTLLIICDLPYPKVKTNSHGIRADGMTMFHLLIRFQLADEQFLTKAFTPVDLSRYVTHGASRDEINQGNGDHDTSGGLSKRATSTTTRAAKIEVKQEFQDRMAFLVKLYSPPHTTSDMFRALDIFHDDNISSNNSNDRSIDYDNNNRKDVLFLRGPIQTYRDRQKNRRRLSRSDVDPTRETKKPDHNRIVMIAAGSGITPMYQVLRALHDQHQMQQSLSLGESEVLRSLEVDEIDLVYCNKTISDIWLRHELQSFESIRQEELLEEQLESMVSEMTAGLSFVKRPSVRIQHVLSSTGPSPPFSSQPLTVSCSDSDNYTLNKYYAGRITIQLLRNILHRSHRPVIPSVSSTVALSTVTQRTNTTTAKVAVTESIDQPQDRPRYNNEHLQILICGPPLFNRDVSGMLAQLGYMDSETCEIHILE